MLIMKMFDQDPKSAGQYLNLRVARRQAERQACKSGTRHAWSAYSVVHFVFTCHVLRL